MKTPATAGSEPLGDSATRSRSSEWSGRLWLLTDRPIAIYAGPGGRTDHHSHHAVQCAVAFDQPMRVTAPGAAIVSAGSLIGPDIAHHIDMPGRVAVFWIDPHAPIGRALTQRIGTTGVEPIELDNLGQPLTTLIEAAALIDRLLVTSGIADDRPTVPSQVVRQALLYLDCNIRDRPRLADVASHVAVSPSHLTHLFTHDVGIPFRRYLLWLRLRRAVTAVAAGANLTDAAALVGFSDSAHLSRAFRGTFGLPPSAMFSMSIERQ